MSYGTLKIGYELLRYRQIREVVVEVDLKCVGRHVRLHRVDTQTSRIEVHGHPVEHGIVDAHGKGVVGCDLRRLGSVGSPASGIALCPVVVRSAFGRGLFLALLSFAFLF